MYWRGKQQAKKSVVNALVGQELSLDTKVVQTSGLVIATPLSRQLETTFDSQKWKSNSRGMIFTMTQMSRRTSISARLVCLVILSLCHMSQCGVSS